MWAGSGQLWVTKKTALGDSAVEQRSRGEQIPVRSVDSFTQEPQRFA